MSKRSPVVLAVVFVVAATTYVVLSLVRGRDIDVTLVLLTGVAAIIGWLISNAAGRRRTGKQ